MNLEEILIKLGLNGSELDQGLRKAGAGLKEFGAKASEHMDKAATSGRALHGVLEGIGKISPGLALGLTAVFSGPLAALELLKMGLEAIKSHYEKIKEAAAEAAAEARKVADSTISHEDRERSAKTSLRERKRELGYEPSQEEAERLKAIQDAENRVAQQKALTEVAKEHEAAAVKAGDKVGEYKAHNAWEELNDDLNKYRDQLDGLKEDYKDQADAAKEFERLAEENATKGIERKKKEREEDEALAKFEDDWADHAYKVKRELAEKTLQLKELENAPYTPSTSDLAKQNGPYGELARLINQREGQAKAASGYASPQERADLQQGVQANTAQLNSDLAAAGGDPLARREAYKKSDEGQDVADAYDVPDWKKGGKLVRNTHHIKGLRELQGKHASDPHLKALEEARNSLRELESLAKSSGIPVAPPPD